MSQIFEWSRIVEFYETDLAGIVHFSNFYRWMESAEHAFLLERGITLHGSADVIGWPRVNASADFKKPVKFGDTIRIRIQIAELRARSIRYTFEFYANNDDTLRATGAMTSVCVDLKTMKAVEIPVSIRAKLSPSP